MPKGNKAGGGSKAKAAGASAAPSVSSLIAQRQDLNATQKAISQQITTIRNDLKKNAATLSPKQVTTRQSKLTDLTNQFLANNVFIANLSAQIGQAAVRQTNTGNTSSGASSNPFGRGRGLLG